MNENEKRIKFLFQPYAIDKDQHIIEKSDESGKKRRYLAGIASGSKVDGHGERITEEAIKDLQEQGNSGDILLFADKHGISMTDDIGRLTKSYITPEGDWYTEWGLYNESDGVGQNTLERANKLWAQLNGLPPYTKKQQRGFSIEGYIPEDGIIQMDAQGRRVINKVILDGCVVVPRPAYTTSIASSIMKALGERIANSRLASKMINKSKQANYWRKKNELWDIMENEIESIMNGEDKEKELRNLFVEFSDMMIDTILNDYPDYNESNTIETVDEIYYQPVSKPALVIKSLIDNLVILETKIRELQ